MILLGGCGVKSEFLPLIGYPYAAEMEFLQEVRNENGHARRKRFPDDRVVSPFYFLLKVKEIENDGIITVRFYKVEKKLEKEGQPAGEMAARREFRFGQTGKYYEYVQFFDRVDELSPALYRYAVFLNEKLILENNIMIFAK